MFLLFKLAIRNLIRHKRRSVLNSIMIGIGSLVMMLVLSFSISIDRRMTKTVIKTCTGNIQIHNKDIENIDIYSTPAADIPLLKDSEKIRALIIDEKEIVAVAPRLRFQGLLSVGEESTGITVNAVDPKVEREITPNIKIIEGTYITEENGILIGRDLAYDLNTKIGDNYTFYSTSTNGDVSQIPITVQGIYIAEGMGMFLDRNLYMNITYAREKLNLFNDEASELAIAITDSNDEGEVINTINSLFIKKGLELKVDSWKDIASMFYGIILASTIIPQISLVIIFITVAFGVINTILMSVLERIKEIGMMKALGTRSAQIMSIFIYEFGILSVIASGSALIIGGVIIRWLSKIGISAPSSILEYVFGGPKLYLIFEWRVFIITFIATVLFCSVISFFTVIKASRLSPIQALYNN